MASKNPRTPNETIFAQPEEEDEDISSQNKTYEQQCLAGYGIRVLNNNPYSEGRYELYKKSDTELSNPSRGQQHIPSATPLSEAESSYGPPITGATATATATAFHPSEGNAPSASSIFIAGNTFVAPQIGSNSHSTYVGRGSQPANQGTKKKKEVTAEDIAAVALIGAALGSLLYATSWRFVKIFEKHKNRFKVGGDNLRLAAIWAIGSLFAVAIGFGAVALATAFVPHTFVAVLACALGSALGLFTGIPLLDFWTTQSKRDDDDCYKSVSVDAKLEKSKVSVPARMRVVHFLTDLALNWNQKELKDLATLGITQKVILDALEDIRDLKVNGSTVRRAPNLSNSFTRHRDLFKTIAEIIKTSPDLTSDPETCKALFLVQAVAEPSAPTQHQRGSDVEAGWEQVEEQSYPTTYGAGQSSSTKYKGGF